MNEYELIPIAYIYRQIFFNFYWKTLYKRKKISSSCFLAYFMSNWKFHSPMIRTINPISVSPMNSKTYSRIRIRNFVTTFALRICDDTFIPRFDLPPHVHSLRYSNLNERLSRPRLLGILLTWLHVCLTKDGPTSLAPISRLSSRN